MGGGGVVEGQEVNVMGAVILGGSGDASLGFGFSEAVPPAWESSVSFEEAKLTRDFGKLGAGNSRPDFGAGVGGVPLPRAAAALGSVDLSGAGFTETDCLAAERESLGELSAPVSCLVSVPFSKGDSFTGDGFILV